MDKRSTPMTREEGRRFGLTVGGAFLVFAAIAWWRGHPTVSMVLATPGVLLAAAGLLLPGQLGPVERGWMALAMAISKVTTPIVMGIMYLLVLTPIGLIRRGVGANPLVHVPGTQGYWKSHSGASRRPESMKRQF
jgi:hypothetical protein